jgi:hypothetical protein
VKIAAGAWKWAPLGVLLVHRGRELPPLASAMTRTDCPLYGDITKLNDGALEFAFDLCRRRQHLPEYAEAFRLIQEEDTYRWNNGGKAKFQAMLIREFGDRARQL